MIYYICLSAWYHEMKLKCFILRLMYYAAAELLSFFCFFLPYHFFLHHLENRTKPISTPYDGRRWWDSNLRTPACKSPALPLCYGRRLLRLTSYF